MARKFFLHFIQCVQLLTTVSARSPDRWTPVNMSNNSYIHQYNEFIRCILRQERGHPFPLRFPITVHQRSAINELIGLLEEPDTAMESLIDAFQQLNWALISARSTEPWQNIHQFFFALLALRMNGTYAPAADLTPHLAKFANYIKYTCMYEALQKPVTEAVRYVYSAHLFLKWLSSNPLQLAGEPPR